MAFQPGQIVYHNYGEVPVLYHTRIILGHITGMEYLIYTPDGDSYVEVCDPSNADLTDFQVGADDGSLPGAIPPNGVYAFAPMSVADFNRILAAGRLEVLERGPRGRRGLPDVGAPLAGDQMVWILAEMIPGHKIGERVTPQAGHARDGVWGLATMTDSENCTRPVLVHQIAVDAIPAFCEKKIQLARESIAAEGEDTHAGSGERQRSFKETVAELQQVEFEDWPLEPRTALAYLKAVAQVAESSFGQHLSWVQQSRIPENDRVVRENEVLSRAIDYAICYDHLNVANLASFELLIRRKQLLAEAYSYGGSTPSYAGADHSFFGGTNYWVSVSIVLFPVTHADPC